MERIIPSNFSSEQEVIQTMPPAKIQLGSISVKRSMQKTLTMLVTEANIMATLSCAQDMMYATRIMESFELKLKLPIILEVELITKGHSCQANRALFSMVQSS